MYKVFFNDCRLIISGTDEGEILNKAVENIWVNDPSQLSGYVLPFLEGGRKPLSICGNKTELWNNFQSFFHHVPAAGGLVKSREGYLFILRNGKWDLPKGKIHVGESYKDAAIREVKEETGLQQVKIIQSLPSTWHIYFSKYEEQGSKPVLKETKWFLMEAAPEQVLVPETVEDIETARWFSPTELESVLKNTYASLSEMIENLI